jgi:hypothetical protein
MSTQICNDKAKADFNLDSLAILALMAILYSALHFIARGPAGAMCSTFVASDRGA